MRRSIRLFVTLVLGLLLNAILVNYANATIRIMPLGDSITRGVTGSSEDTGYRRELFLSLVQTGYQLNFVGSLSDGTPGDFDDDHEGHSGFHADGSPAGDGNDIFDNVLDWLIDQQNFGNPTDIVLLHIGTNDITNGGEDANEVDAILDEIYQYDPNTWVILARIINRVNYSQETTDFNNSVEAMVQNRIILGDNLLLVDMEDGAGIIYSDQPGGDMFDDIHPNDTGYEKIANLWFPAVQQVTQPVADAGPDQSVNEFDIVTLDGSNSSDPDGIIASYFWNQTGGTPVVLSNDSIASPTFTAPDVGSAGDTLTFNLLVTDKDGFQSTDTTSVIVDNPNSSSGGGGGGGGGGCFITTAAHGSPMEPHFGMLRESREHSLLTKLVGTTLVDLYNTYSPTVADFIAEYKTLRAMVRWSFAPLVGMSWLALHIGLLAAIISAAIMVLLATIGVTHIQ